MDCSPPGSSAEGILQTRVLEWVAIPFSRGSSQPSYRTQVCCIAGRFLTFWTTYVKICGGTVVWLFEEGKPAVVSLLPMQVFCRPLLMHPCAPFPENLGVRPVNLLASKLPSLRAWTMASCNLIMPLSVICHFPDSKLPCSHCVFCNSLCMIFQKRDHSWVTSLHSATSLETKLNFLWQVNCCYAKFLWNLFLVSTQSSS